MYERDLLRADATVEFQKDLDGMLRTQYPVINTHEAVRRYRNGESTFASFSLSHTPRADLSTILVTALKRSSDQNDPAFCAHGDEHKTFDNTISALVGDVHSGTATVQSVPFIRNILTQDGRADIQVHRLEIEGQQFERSTFRPAAQQLALEIQSRVLSFQQPDAVRYPYTSKVIRRAAAQYGVPFAILTAALSGLQAQQIIEIFSPKDVRKRIEEQRHAKGIERVKFPFKSENHAHIMITRIIDDLMERTATGLKPKRTSEGMSDALSEFTYDYHNDIAGEARLFVETSDLVRPRAIFYCMDEIAHRSADPKFADPYRTLYIDERYGNVATTHMITAYLAHSVHPINYLYQKVL